MASETLTQDLALNRAEGLSWMQRQAVRRFHPVSIFFDAVGLTWFTYFLWQHNWVAAVAVVAVERLAAVAIIRHADVSALAKTGLGKLALLHLHPANVVIQLLGFAAIVAGLWQHEGLAILGGLSVVFLGHTFGWPKVDSRFSLGH